MTDSLATARRLGRLTEPLAAAIYFSPEASEGYQALGLNYFEGYFCSRGAGLGKAPWSAIAAAFAAFKPAVVERAVTGGWEKTGPEPVLAARLAGATAQLERLLGAPGPEVSRATELLERAVDGVDPSGRPLYAGLTQLERPEDPWGRFWRAADRVREHRGDGHVNAWTPHLDSCEITTLSELCWDIPPRTYVYTRGYDEADVDAAYARLEARGLIADGTATDEGRALRSLIERTTDSADREVVVRLDNDADELFARLEPWSKAIVAGGGYPVDPSDLHGIDA